MITTVELYRAIRERLKQSFPEVLIQQKDIKNIIRPSIYIKYIGKNFEKQAQTIYDDRMSFNLVYFSEKEELLELLEFEETILKAFKAPLKIQDDTNIIEVEKDALQSNLNEDDYITNVTIDFVLTQTEIDEEDGDDIEEISIKINNGDSEIYEDSDETMSDVDMGIKGE